MGRTSTTAAGRPRDADTKLGPEPRVAKARAWQAWVGYVAPGALLGLFLLLALLWTGGYDGAYRAVLDGFGLNIYKPTPPFFDAHAVLSAIECHATGFHVLRYNPCDIAGRQHIYGSAWLMLAPLGLGTSMTLWVGVGLDLLFIAALFLLPRARRWREVMVLIAAFMSPAVVFALERGNNDLVVWLFALAIAWLAVRGPLSRALAYGLVGLAALLKFYPIALLAMLAREKSWRARAIGLALGTVLTWLLLHEITLTTRVYALGNYNVDMFGASKLVFAVVPGAVERKWLQWAVTIAMTAYLASVSARMIGRYRLLPRIAALPDSEAMMALAGAAILIACFFGGLSISYRAIHLLLILPAIQRLWREAMDQTGRRFLMGVSCVALWCLWSQAVWSHLAPHANDVVELGLMDTAVIRALVVMSELGWWWLMAVLIAISACIVWTSPGGKGLRTLFVSHAD